MATALKNNVEDTKQSALSPRLKGRGMLKPPALLQDQPLAKRDRTGADNWDVVENAKDTLCRNVTIYGKCRYEDKGCAFSHNIDKQVVDSGNNESQAKKTLNVESPSFTPSFLSPNGTSASVKKAPGISPKAASAAPFMPKAIISRSSNATPLRQEARTPDWAVANVQEFIPRGTPDQHMANENEIPVTQAFEPFQPASASNPYLDQNINGAAFYSGGPEFQQPVQYHQYAPIGPFSANLAPYQRTVHDLFIPNDLREEIQKKAAATLQTMPGSTLPSQIENYHSLVPLDANHKSSSVLGNYNSWIYKAQSNANGHFFVLRRIEGFRLTNEMAIRAGQAWKSVISPNIVRTVDVFTNRGFGDSSLFFAMDYFPLAKTLLEYHHIGPPGPNWTRSTRASKDQVSEPIMWSYIVQIASALKTIHASDLAARVLDLSKVLVTGKNRIRLNGCGILDVVQYDGGTLPTAQLQRQDLVNFGILVLSLGSGYPDAGANFVRSMDIFKRFYKADLQNAVVWLYSAVQNQEKTIDHFLTLISSQMVKAFNASLHSDDALYSELSREVENARLVRLVTKLNFINERPEFEHDRAWSENGERYFLKLFRDYVFHQVDGQGRPVVDLGHVLTCLNKLDAGTEEKITLISRDEQSCFVVTYREVKKGIESAFQELVKRGGPMR